MRDTELANLHEQIVASLSSATTVTPVRDRRGNLVHRYPAPFDFPGGKDQIELTLEFEWFHVLGTAESDAMAQALVQIDGCSLSAIGMGKSNLLDSLIVRHEPRPDAPQATDQYLDAPDRPLLSADATVRHRTDASPFMTWGSGSTNIELPYARPRPGLGHRVEWNFNTGLLPVGDLARQAVATPGQSDRMAALNPFHWLLVAVPSLDPTALEPQVVIQKTRRKFTFNDADTGEKRFALNIDLITAKVPDGRRAIYSDVEMAIESRVDAESFAASVEVAEKLRAAFGLVPNDVTRYRRALEAVAEEGCR